MADIGIVQIGSYIDFYFTITNTTFSTQTYSFDGWTVAGGPGSPTDGVMEYIGEAFPFVLDPLETAQGVIRFTPTAEASYNRLMQVDLSPGGSKFFGFYGWGAVAHDPALSVQPQQLNFPDTFYTDESEPQKITVANVSPSGTFASDVIISAITPAARFELVTTPDLPLTLARGESIELFVKFVPDGNNGDHSSASGVVITADDDGSPHAVVCIGYAYITAIESVAGFDKDTLLAFAFGAGPTVSVKEVLEDDLDCEEVQYAEKVFGLDNPGIDKVITDIFLKYEDLGVATLALKVWRKIKNTDDLITQQKDLTVGTTGADEKPLRGDVHGFTLDGEFLGFTLYKEVDSGPFSLIDNTLKYLLGEIVLGSLAFPTISNSIANVGDETSQPLLAFNHETNGPTMKKVNPLVLNCEEDAYFEHLSVFDLDGYEKAVMRHWMKLEDFGEVTVSLTLTSQRSADSPVEITVGGVGDERKINAVFNTAWSGELMNYKISRDADEGPLSIIRMSTKIEPKGELMEV